MYRYVKRLLDVVLSLAGMPFLFILFICIAPVIMIDDKGPVFYNAPRLGYKGKIFKMYKFRSMRVDAPDLRNADGTTFNSEDDPRVTRVGRFLRRTSFDEVPQLLNVLKGDMSLVGPRPDLADAAMSSCEVKKLTVRPGITGYSQAYFRNSDSIKQRMNNDLFYVDNISFWLDIRILLKTIVTVFYHSNIYRNEGNPYEDS